MKAKILSTIFCILVLVASVCLIFYFPEKEAMTETETETVTYGQIPTDPAEKMSRSYVIETAHDAEDFFTRLAYGENKEYKAALSDLVIRMESCAEYMKNELKDYHGAGYFAAVAGILKEVETAPFTDSVTFSSRVSRMLTALESSYPTQGEEPNENHPETPMYYPKFDTDASGKTALGLLAIYRQQYAEQNNAILITLGGNMIAGETLLEAERLDSFKAKQEKSKYSYPLYKSSAILGTDAVTFANLQNPLTESIGNSQSAGSIKGLPSYAALLKNGGLDVISLSDPGVLGFGENGKKDTITALTEAKLPYSDGANVATVETKLGKATFISYNIIEDIRKNVNLSYKDAPKADIAAARANGAVFVVVHFNWINTEKNAWDPCMGQVNTARAAVDNGADLVIGTHPDAAESIEQYKGVSIVYSPGNLSNKNGIGTTNFIFQQAFTVNGEGKAVPGQIQVIPLKNTSGDDPLPTPALDNASAAEFINTIVRISKTLRYGVNKRAEFKADALNVISITK